VLRDARLIDVRRHLCRSTLQLALSLRAAPPNSSQQPARGR
jgi:hypothetical protein